MLFLFKKVNTDTTVNTYKDNRHTSCTRTCSRTLRSTDQKLLAVPKSRLKTYGDRAFSVAAPKLWNELPLDLRSLDTINLFKKHLKTDLFEKAYNV